MALAAAAIGARGPVAIEGAEHVAKSYPRFFSDLAEAGARVQA
jgi:5-enolpyruvylshikimate-3-phosphate synthase